ncbi:MAG: MFS transporter [Desulfobacterales bacterium]|nr:MFS transporter [Desulfobacterales bacterium]
MNRPHQSPGATLFVVSAVQFLTPFMMSAVGVALPAIGTEFHAGAMELGLVEMVYILAFALIMLPVGRAADIHGRKKVFVSGTVLFTLATLALALSPNMGLFLAFRFLQGSGAAMVTATSVAILSAIFPPEKRGRAMGVIIAAVYIGLSAGPTLAGFMITHLGWRWIFFSALPIELLALFLTLAYLKGEWQSAPGMPFDWTGSGIYVTALFCLILGASHLNQGPSYAGLLVMGLLGLWLFFRHQSRCGSPILDTRLLGQNPTFTMGNLATLITYAASFGVTFFFSLYLQQVKGISPRDAGLILVTQPLIQALLSPLSGKLTDNFSPPRIAATGMALCTLALALCTTIEPHTPLPRIYGILVILGIGFALFATPNMTTIMGSVTPEHDGIASSFVATMRTLGMLTAMTLITCILHFSMGKSPVTPETIDRYMEAMETGFMIFTGIGIMGILCSVERNKPTP